MEQGEIIVLLIFGAGVACSLTLFFLLLRLIRRERKQPHIDESSD